MARRALRHVPAAVAVALVACSREPPAPASSAASASVAVPDGGADVEEEPAPDPLPPPPHVEVTNIGMHIGGGPNDAASKDPIARAVAPHFDDFRRCYAQVDPPRPGDFGVDLLIGAEGGVAHVDNPRTSLGEPFTDCMTAAFLRIEFDRLKTGKTKVSYSLRFVP